MTSAATAELIAQSMTAAIAAFAALLLLARETSRRDQAAFLAAFFILYAIFMANDVLTALGGYAAAPILAVLTTPVRFLFGAAIFFYARSMTSPSPARLRRRDALALIWPAAGLAAIIPFMLMSADDKNSLMREEFTSQEMRDWFILTCKVIFALFLGSAFVYLAAAFRLLLRHTQSIRRLFSNIENKSLGWLRAILFVLALGWSWDAASGLWAILGDLPGWVSLATAYFELSWIGAIAFCGLVQQPIFDEAPAAAVADGPGSGKYARSALDENRMTRIAANLERAMRVEKRFVDSNLSLRSLSEHLGVSEHYVSQTLNEKLGETFFDFVNRHRVDEARRRLETTDEPIIEIAHGVGYNTRSTFNAAFKSRTGMTPSACRKAAKSGVCADPRPPQERKPDEPAGSYMESTPAH